MSKQEKWIPISRVESLLETLKQCLENGTLNSTEDLREIAENALLFRCNRKELNPKLIVSALEMYELLQKIIASADKLGTVPFEFVDLFNKAKKILARIDEEQEGAIMSEELKPCPFCGGEGLENQSTHPSRPTRYYIMCSNCGANSEFQYSKQDAIKSWNTRSEYQTMNENLKPCPFCGSEGFEDEVTDFFNKEKRYCIVCSKCKAGATYLSSKQAAITAWNTRAEAQS